MGVAELSRVVRTSRFRGSTAHFVGIFVRVHAAASPLPIILTRPSLASGPRDIAYAEHVAMLGEMIAPTTPL